MFKIKTLPKYAQKEIKSLYFCEERDIYLGNCQLKNGDGFMFYSRKDLLNQIKEHQQVKEA